MAEQRQQQQDVPMRTIRVKNTSARGSRFIHDASGRQVLLGPGQEQEIELTEVEAKRLEQASENAAPGVGGGIMVAGFEPEPLQRPEGAPDIPDEHLSRGALMEAEKELMEEGQEADRERREKDAKKLGPQLAAETGIHMHARGLAPEVIAQPPELQNPVPLHSQPLHTQPVKQPGPTGSPSSVDRDQFRE